MKKTFIILFTLMLVFMLASCNESETESEAGSSAFISESQAVSDEESTEASHIHSFSEATCKAPKTCDICGETEGDVGEHSYENGVCSVCGKSNILNPQESLDMEYGDYTGNYRMENGQLVSSGVSFGSDAEGTWCLYGTHFYEEGGSIAFGDKTYGHSGFGFSATQCELSDTKITVKEEDKVILELQVQADSTLVVIYANQELENIKNSFSVGLILSLEAPTIIE